MRRQLSALLLPLFFLACSGGKGSIDGQPLTESGASAPVLTATTQPLDILIFGGTSGVGLETTKLALSRGHRVTSITRHPERMSIQHANLSNLMGDITKRDSFNALIAGKSVVISAIGLKPTRKEVTVFSEGMKNVLAAMNEFQVRRVITITGIGAGDSKDHGGFFYDWILNPLMLKTAYQDKTRQEIILTASDSQWTIVRPGAFSEQDAEQRYRVVQTLDGVIAGDISRADVAHFLVAVAEQGSYIGNTVLLTN